MSAATSSAIHFNYEPNEVTICPLCNSMVNDNDEAVLCDGVCKTWYHRSCMGMMSDHYSRISDKEVGYTEWYCPFCDGEYVDGIDSMPLSIWDKSLEDWQCDLSSADMGSVTDGEALRLAGVVGKALLVENEKLKRSNGNLSNSLAVQEIDNEELRTRNERLLERQHELLQMIQERDSEIERLKANSMMLQQLYEDHDLEQSKIIKTQEAEIVQLQYKIKKITKVKTYSEEECPMASPLMEAVPKNPLEVIVHPEEESTPLSTITGIGSVLNQVNLLMSSYKNMNQRLTSLEESIVCPSIASDSVQLHPSDLATSIPALSPKSSADILRRPPMNAKLLLEGQSFEDFFIHNIDEYLLNNGASDKPALQVQDVPIFLQDRLHGDKEISIFRDRQPEAQYNNNELSDTNTTIPGDQNEFF